MTTVRAAILAVATYLLMPVQSHAANDSTAKQYRVIVAASGILTGSRVERSTLPDQSDYTNNLLGGALRLTWRPEHLVGIGIEATVLPISTMSVIQDSRLPSGTTMSLSAVPLMAVVTMEKWGVEVSAGVGTYIYTSQARLAAQKITSSDIESGWMLGAGYVYPLSRAFAVHTDVRLYSIPYRGVSVATAGLGIRWQAWY